MRIISTTQCSVRLKTNMHDLFNLFTEKTGVRDIKDFKVLLMSDSGDKSLNANIIGISLVGVEVWS